jgi:hypothetical protein
MRRADGAGIIEERAVAQSDVEGGKSRRGETRTHIAGLRCDAGLRAVEGDVLPGERQRGRVALHAGEGRRGLAGGRHQQGSAHAAPDVDHPLARRRIAAARQQRGVQPGAITDPRLPQAYTAAQQPILGHFGDDRGVHLAFLRPRIGSGKAES